MSPPSWRDVDVYCRRERRADSRPPPFPELTGSRRSVHPAHATAAGHRGHLLLLLLLHHHALGGEEQSRDGGGVLQRRAGDLGRVDDAGRDQILVPVGLGVVAVVQLGRLLHLPHDDRALRTRILNDDPDRLLERSADDFDARLLVIIGAPDLVERLPAPRERDTAARRGCRSPPRKPSGRVKTGSIPPPDCSGRGRSRCRCTSPTPWIPAPPCFRSRRSCTPASGTTRSGTTTRSN